MSEVLFEKIRLEFDTPQFLHALFANDPKNLAYLEAELRVKAVTREGWIQSPSKSRRSPSCAAARFPVPS